METLGKWLQIAREARGLSLEQAEQVTRIRRRYLKALEEGNYEALPGGEAQTRGFLRRYAALLGLSPDEAIIRYDEEVHGRRPEPPAPPAAPTPATPAMPINRPHSNWLQVVAVIGLVILLLLGAWWLLSYAGWAPPPASPPEATTAPLMTLSRAAVGATAGQATPAFPVSSSGVTLTLEPTEHVWVRVTADGAVVFEGLLAPGEAPSWTAQERVVVETGNGAGLVAVVNGQSQGPLGERGQVCARAWAPTGAVDVVAPPGGG
jgi:cytoskeleton protein RodZ